MSIGALQEVNDRQFSGVFEVKGDPIPQSAKRVLSGVH